MKGSLCVAVILGAIPCVVVQACSAPSQGGYGALGEPTATSTSAPPTGTDAGTDAPHVTTCAEYAAMADASTAAVEAGTESDAADASDDGSFGGAGGSAGAGGGGGAAGFTPSPCQPSGDYVGKLTTRNSDCPSFPNGDEPDHGISYANDSPFPIPGCDPPVQTFSDGVCQVFLPPGTYCKLYDFLVTDCAYYSCNSDASSCSWHIAVKYHPGKSGECSVEQTWSGTRK